jgi:hypothetical protein
MYQHHFTTFIHTQAVRDELGYLPLEDGSDRSFQNVGS